MRRYSYALCLTLLAPALMGPSCEDDVDLGGSPDAGPAVGDAAMPAADAGGATTADAGAVDAAAPATGEPVPYARGVLIDVFDGADSTVTTTFEVSFESTVPVTADVRAERLEVLAPDGTVDFVYPLGGVTLRRHDFEPERSRQVYSAFVTASPGGVAPLAGAACADDTYPSRLLHHGVRVVASVDGVEAPRVQIVPGGTGGFPPMRPMVLCHERVRVERTYDPFHNVIAGFTLRPDGLYDVELWESAGAASYTAAAPLVDVDPTVRISPLSAYFHPGYYPTFDAEMEHLACAPSGCTLDEAMVRHISGASAVPMRVPVSTELYWCAQPAPGDDHSGLPWPPSEPSDGYYWLCRGEDGGDGAGFARFSGTTESGPFAVEVFVAGGSWRYAEPHPW